MTDETKTALLSELRAPVADERRAFETRFNVPPDNWTRSGGGGYRDIWHETRWEGWRARAALASAPVAGEAQRLDAPAQVGGTRFGKGIHWSTVIHAAQRHHEYMQDPAREAERIAQAKKFQALVAGDAAPQANEAVPEVAGVTLDGCLETLFRVGEHLGIDYAESRKLPGAPSGVYIKAIEDRVSQARDTALEEAAKLMDQTSRSTGATLIRAALSAQPGAQKEQSDE